MNKEKALERIDAAIKTLTGLGKHNDSCSTNMKVQILWLELGNLREMVENMEDKDK